MEPNRLVSTLPPTAFKTYAIAAPVSTHYRPASCEEVNCQHYHKGWQTRVPRESASADYIRSGHTGRQYREVTSLGDAEATFWFDPGQPCFRHTEHVVPLEREPLYVVRVGDHRPAGEVARFSSADAWLDDFATHQDRISRERA